MTEEEKEAEGVRILQEYLAERREKQQIPGTREYEIEQMCRKVREEIAAMSQEERYELHEGFQMEIAKIRAEISYPPKGSEEPLVAETDIVAMWRSYPIRVHLD
jgi:hypothetical protein